MGMYTSVRFKGIIKPEYSEGFEGIAMRGEWENSKHEIFREFGKMNRAGYIPCGGLCGSKWGNSSSFKRNYYALMNYWQFECSLKNQEGEVQTFMELIPKFVQELYHFEEMYEECEYSTLYELRDGILTPSGRYAWNKYE